LSCVPRRRRVCCSFDTDYGHGNLAHLWYWAVGQPNRPANPLLTVVDTAAQRIESRTALVPETAFEHWLAEALQDGHPGAAIDAIYPLCNWLAGGDEPGFSPAALDVVETQRLLGLSPTLADDRLRQSLQATLGEDLTELSFPTFRARLSIPELTLALRDGVSAQVLVDELLRHFAAARYAPPSAAVLEALQRFLATQPNRPLQLLASAWSGSWRALARQLDELSVAEYDWAVEVLLGAGWAPPSRLIGNRRGKELLAARRRQGPWRPAELEAVVGQLCLTGQQACLTDLIPTVATLRPKDAARLLEVTARDRAVPERFVKTLEATAERDGGGLFGWFGRRGGRS